MSTIRSGATPVALSVLGLCLGAILSVAAPAAGQEGAERDDDLEGIDEITVSITRRAESVQEIAGAVSAFDADQIEEYGVEQLSDVVSLIPGMLAKGDHASVITVRGISQSFTLGAQAPVARHVNGVFRFDNASYLGQFYDLQAVEVVRGPSGTVYGRNATAGAMNVVWNEPHDAFEVLGDVTVGNYDRYRFRGVANLPLLGEGDERLMARLVLQREVYDGWVDNLLTPRRQDPDHGDDTYYRLSVRSVLDEDAEITVRTWRNQRDSGEVGVKAGLDSFREGRFPNFDPLTGGPVPFDGYNGLQNFLLGTEANAAGPLYSFGLVEQFLNGGTLVEAMQRVLVNGAPPAVPPLIGDPASFIPAPSDPSNPRETFSRASNLGNSGLEAWGVDGELEWLLHDIPLLGDVQLNLLAGWESLDLVNVVNVDASSVPFIEQRDAGLGKTLVSELRLSSASEGPIQWIAGLFYFERDFVREQRAIGFFGLAEGFQEIEESGWAPFLNVTWAPIEEVEFFGGVRWNRDTFERSEFSGAIAGIRPAATLDGRKERFRETTRELGFRWFFADEHMLYAKFSKGYKAGFVEIDQNGQFAPAGSANVIAPELIDAWEAGVKTSWLDATLLVNVSGYFYGYDDLQVAIPLGLQALTRNAASATIKGGELEVVYQPVPNWNTRLAVSYIHTVFGAFCSPDPFQFSPADDPGCERDATNPAIPPPNGVDGNLDLSGNRLEDTPEWQVSVVSRFTYPLGEWGTLTSVLSFRWVDDYFARPFNIGLVDGIDSYTQTGIRFIWRSPDERYTVEIFGSHLEDESIYGRRIVPPEFVANPALIGLYAPRRYGIRIGFEWGGK
jgi:iron complex outermembrane receptor protein